MSKKSLKLFGLLILIFFSLSGTSTSVEKDTTLYQDIVIHNSIARPMDQKREQEQVAYPTAMYETDENGFTFQVPLFHDKDLPTILDDQEIVIHKNIQKADDMGKELDQIIKALEEHNACNLGK
jgi:hypothetical protein